MPSKRILITGASGFIGACLARSLAAQGHDTHLILRDQSKLWRLQGLEGKFSIHKTGLLDYEALSGAVKEIQPEVVYHLATYGAYAHQKDYKLSVETNVLGTMNLVTACKDYAKSIINVTSSSEYGKKDHAMREDDVLEPNSLYGVTKAAATLYCQHMARDNGVPITTFRIFAAYGYYEDPIRLMPSLIVPFLKGESPKLSSPHSVRDFIFVDDIIEAFETAARTKACRGEVLNLGTGTQHTVGEVAALTKELVGSDRDVVWGATEKKQAEPGMWVADMAKTTRVLGWKPKNNLRKGLEKAVRWYRDNLGLYG